jgi:hypothetical protein
MKLSESPIIHFIRSVTLLATLIVVPGIAIFWNHLPKRVLHKSESKREKPETENSQFFKDSKDSDESLVAVSAFAPLAPIEPTFLLPAPKVTSEPVMQQVSWEPSQQEFESLELRLKALGATYYRLEKWGNRGELFRFSCFVTPLESHSYEKYFQAIDADAVTVMRSVIADIETWKHAANQNRIL